MKSRYNHIQFDYYNPTNGLVQGYQYAAEFFNGAVFTFWASQKLNRKQARKIALMIANGDYNPPIYYENDIVWVRKQK